MVNEMTSQDTGRSAASHADEPFGQTDGRPRLLLRGICGTAAGQMYDIPQAGALLGRAPDCSVQVDPQQDVKVSGRHGRIELRDGHWCYTDLGSTNGSLVNAQVVVPRQPAVLETGDILTLGEDGSDGTVAFEVEISGDGSSRAHEPPIHFRCAQCGADNNAAHEMMGLKISCSRCGQSVDVPMHAPLFGSRAPSEAPSSNSHLDKVAKPEKGYRIGGLFGKVKRAYQNLQDRREVQVELNSRRLELTSVQRRFQDGCRRLGEQLWTHMPDQAKGLTAAAALTDGARRLDELTKRSTAAAEDERSLRDTLRQWIEAWQARMAPVSQEQEQAQKRYGEQSQRQQEALEQVRTALTEVLRSTREPIQKLSQVAEGRPSGQVCESIVEFLETTSGQFAAVGRELGSQAKTLEPLQTTLRRACDQTRSGASCLTEVEKCLEAFQKERQDHERQALEAIVQAERTAREAAAETERLRSQWAEHFLDLGREYVADRPFELNTDIVPLVDEVQPQFDRQEALLHEIAALEKQFDTLR